ncbi:conserved hypothetical protein [Solidesulfovibrio fructosivorans JJ]]|uniref:Uncharacterized protein n=1 Tax=Solidesulfovibrio fructosivorans JJ] TaxID=596151 RepID=E1JYQ1_SOLFR|nr:hypothetical protein [Solidesulfovibrio fructosivorans]EFL50471.1 conserved hypothetical protein [Solidesulfovibrio fructosivorans JJ]]
MQHIASNLQAFRRGHTVGQTVKGRLLSPGPGGLFWVVVSGIKLLASLDHEPVPGRELIFRIKALEPELILKDITPPPSSATEPGLLLAGIAAARTRFERHLSRLAPPSCPPLDLTAARRHFRDWLAGDAPAQADFSAVQELFRLARTFVPRIEGHPRYLPWVFPGLTQAEALTARLSPEQGGPGFRLRLFGHLSGPGRLAIEASHHPASRKAPARTVYRLMLEHPQEAADCMAMLADLRFGKAVLAPACLSAGALPAPLAAGFLARIVAATARPFTGLRLRV